LIHPDDTTKFGGLIKASAKRRSGFQLQARWLLKSGHAAAFDSIGKWIPADGGSSQYLLLCSREAAHSSEVDDIADNGALPPVVRAETLRLLARAESEKNHVARAIHDDLGQKLTALTLELSLWKSELDSAQSKSVSAIREKIAVLTGLANGMIAFTRKVTATLRPRVLEEFGLVAALEWHVEKVQKQTGMSCTFSAGLEKFEIEPFLASQLFRVVEEVIQLRLRAACESLHLRLLTQDGVVVLVFEDSGRERQLTAEISARVRLLGGEIEVNSEENSIVVALPLNSGESY
jgi:signal transduction histidine kinase